jgi:hypothetical protein
LKIWLGVFPGEAAARCFSALASLIPVPLIWLRSHLAPLIVSAAIGMLALAASVFQYQELSKEAWGGA